MTATIFDWKLTVEKLNGNEIAAREIVPLFFKELEKSQYLVNEAYDLNDAGKLYEHLHKLHGSCCYVGVPSLKEITYAFCQSAKAHRNDEFPTYLTRFNVACDEVLKVAKEFVIP